ncbi:hypothetical protein STEG23_013324, partial [Scotinomys teguina]
LSTINHQPVPFSPTPIYERECFRNLLPHTAFYKEIQNQVIRENNLCNIQKHCQGHWQCSERSTDGDVDPSQEYVLVDPSDEVFVDPSQEDVPVDPSGDVFVEPSDDEDPSQEDVLVEGL